MEQVLPDKTRFRVNRKILIIIGIIVSLAVIAVSAFKTRPELSEQLILSIDSFGVTDVGEHEKWRVATINKLPITYEEKQVLINRTVFLGASVDMVRLALGEPLQYMRSTTSTSSTEVVHLQYHFQNDQLPTLLTFENNRLVNAQKRSNVSLGID